MPKLLLCLFMLVGIVFTPLSYALRVIPIADNATFSLTISTKEPTRIFVADDRITKIHGIEGAYNISKDESQGEIFIQPSPTYLNKEFNVFISTEQGHHYTLLLKPLDIQADNIQLKPLSPALTRADRWEKNSPYVQTLIRLMNAMFNEDLPEGYVVSELAKTKLSTMTSGISMQLLTLYRGNHLQGELWLVKNQSRKTVYLHSRQFYQEGTLAASLEDEVLNSGDDTILYRVLDHG